MCLWIQFQEESKEGKMFCIIPNIVLVMGLISTQSRSDECFSINSAGHRDSLGIQTQTVWGWRNSMIRQSQPKRNNYYGHTILLRTFSPGILPGKQLHVARPLSTMQLPPFLQMLTPSQTGWNRYWLVNIIKTENTKIKSISNTFNFGRPISAKSFISFLDNF